MQIDPLTPTHLKRYNSAIFAVKELIEAQHVDGYEFLIDTLMMAFYGIDDIVSELEIQQRQDILKKAMEAGK